jgi:peroxiredoxin
VILTFYRGRWCPYCNVELRSLQRTLDEFKSLGASLLALSPQTVEHTQAFAEEAPLRFRVLADVNLQVAKQFGVVYTLNNHATKMFDAFGITMDLFNGSENKEELPLPATYIIAPDRTISFVFIDADYTKRAEPADVIAALRDLKQAS